MEPPRLPREGRVLRRAVVLRRFENSASDVVERILATTRDRLVRIMERQDPSDVTPGWREARLRSVTAKADRVIVAAYGEIHQAVRDELRGLAVNRALVTEAEIAALLSGVDVVADFLRRPTRDQLWAIATTDPVQGAVMRDWWGSQSRQLRDRFRREIRAGLTQREQIGDLVRRIRGRSVGRGRFTGGVMETTTREATALVRTAVNEVSNRATLRTLEQNGDIIRGVEWVAVLDERTCPICARLDGTVWTLDDPARQQPPIHFQDRCALVPVLNYAAVGARNPRREPRQVYFDWFARQPAGVQDRILGPRRGAIVRRGEATFSDLLRRDGTLIPLAQLEVA